MSGAVESFGKQIFHYFGREDEGVLREPLDGPSAWRGEVLTRDPEAWTERLDAEEIAELEAAVASVRERGLALRDVGREAFPLGRLGGRIRGWAETLLTGRGFLRVRGLPVARWGDEDAALAYWGIGQHLGRPGAQNPEGDLLGNVRDTGEEALDPNVRRYKTAGDIAFHCDLADAVGLLCLRRALRGGASRIASSVTVYNEILARRPGWIGRLYEPFALDSRNEERAGAPAFIPVAPCRFARGRLSTFYHSDYFRSAARHPEVELGDVELGLLDLFDEVANDPALRLDMELEVGDIQLISNHTIVHARTAYEDGPAAHQKRHLLRLWLSLDRGDVRT
jgi:hypothetical protein